VFVTVGGSPFELISVYGVKVQRYRLAGYVIAGYAALFWGIGQYNKLTYKPPAVVYESKQQEAWVGKYVLKAEKESHKPQLVRQIYQGPSGLN
jgi:hypothetical protein